MKKYRVNQMVYVKEIGYGEIIEIRNDGGVTDYYVRFYAGGTCEYFENNEIR